MFWYNRLLFLMSIKNIFLNLKNVLKDNFFFLFKGLFGIVCINDFKSENPFYPVFLIYIYNVLYKWPLSKSRMYTVTTCYCISFNPYRPTLPAYPFRRFRESTSLESRLIGFAGESVFFAIHLAVPPAPRSIGFPLRSR